MAQTTFDYLGHEIKLKETATEVFDDFDFWEKLANETNILRQQALQIQMFAELFGDFDNIKKLCIELDGKVKVSRLNEIIEQAPKG